MSKRIISSNTLEEHQSSTYPFKNITSFYCSISENQGFSQKFLLHLHYAYLTNTYKYTLSMHKEGFKSMKTHICKHKPTKTHCLQKPEKLKMEILSQSKQHSLIKPKVCDEIKSNKQKKCRAEKRKAYCKYVRKMLTSVKSPYLKLDLQQMSENYEMSHYN